MYRVLRSGRAGKGASGHFDQKGRVWAGWTAANTGRTRLVKGAGILLPVKAPSRLAAKASHRHTPWIRPTGHTTAAETNLGPTGISPSKHHHVSRVLLGFIAPIRRNCSNRNDVVSVSPDYIFCIPFTTTLSVTH